MFLMHQSIRLSFLIISSLLSIAVLEASDFITITTPANASTVSGQPLVITGTSSQASFLVRLTINSTVIAFVLTDGSGNWNYNYDDLPENSYTITAELLSGTFEILATATNSFTVDNPERITIISPQQDEFVLDNPALIFGESTLATSTVNIWVDSTLMTSTFTNENGAWQALYTLPSNGPHTLLAELITNTVVASSTVNIVAAGPILFPVGQSEMKIVAGRIPTSGSGSGFGFTYTTGVLSSTITFSPAFSASPVVVCSGQNSLGLSTAAITSVSASTLVIGWNLGTTNVHFVAALID